MEDIKCLFGLHKYEVYKELDLTDVRGNIIGKIIVTKCSKCGKIHKKNIITTNGY